MGVNQRDSKKSILKDERGMATIETLPLLIIFLILLGFALGYFGAIHTGILNSIAARNYAFETFRHRANLTYFRDHTAPKYMKNYYAKAQVRFHSIAAGGKDEFTATERPISIGLGNSEEKGGDKATHNTRVPALTNVPRNTDVSVNPIWVKSTYGICINAVCGE